MNNEQTQGGPVFFVTASAVAVVLNLTWFGFYTFVNAFVIETRGATNTEWTQSTLWFLSGMLTGQLFCTEVAARIGRRPTVTMALMIAAGAYLGLFFLSDRAMIRLTLAFMGVTPAVLFVVWLAMVVEHGGHRPGKAIAQVMLINSIVGTITLATGSMLSDVLDHRRLFLLFSVACFFSGLCFHRFSGTMESGQPPAVVSFFRLKKNQLQKIFVPAFAIVILAGFCTEALLSLTVNQLFPNLARDIGDLNNATIGTIVAIGRLPALICLFGMSLIIDRVEPYLCYGLGLTGAGLLVIGLGNSAEGIALTTLYLLFYLVYGVIWGANMASLNASVEPRLRDAAFAIASTATVISVVLTGVVHRLLLGANVSLAALFTGCGSVGAGSGVVLVLFSWLHHQKKS